MTFPANTTNLNVNRWFNPAISAGGLSLFSVGQSFFFFFFFQIEFHASPIWRPQCFRQLRHQTHIQAVMLVNICFLLEPSLGQVLINALRGRHFTVQWAGGISFEVQWGATYCRVWGEASQRETVSFGSSLMQLLRDYGWGSSERHMEQSVIAPLNKIRRWTLPSGWNGVDKAANKAKALRRRLIAGMKDVCEPPPGSRDPTGVGDGGERSEASARTAQQA